MKRKRAYGVRPYNIKVGRSRRKNKTHVVTFNLSGVSSSMVFKVHFGSRARNSPKSERARQYLARARKIKDGGGRLTFRNPLSPNYWSVKAWEGKLRKYL